MTNSGMGDYDGAGFVVPEGMNCAAEYDIEYDNGFRETITLRLGESFTMPFDGKIVAQRVVTLTPGAHANRTERSEGR